MKPSVIAMIFLGIAVFVGGVVALSMQSSQVDCEVCLVFDDGEVCRRGSGASEAEALAAAQASACGGNTSGMAEAIACMNRPPDRATCPVN